MKETEEKLNMQNMKKESFYFACAKGKEYCLSGERKIRRRILATPEVEEEIEIVEKIREE
jgi:hypothetical protein